MSIGDLVPILLCRTSSERCGTRRGAAGSRHTLSLSLLCVSHTEGCARLGFLPMRAGRCVRPHSAPDLGTAQRGEEAVGRGAPTKRTGGRLRRLGGGHILWRRQAKPMKLERVLREQRKFPTPGGAAIAGPPVGHDLSSGVQAAPLPPGEYDKIRSMPDVFGDKVRGISSRPQQSQDKRKDVRHLEHEAGVELFCRQGNPSKESCRHPCANSAGPTEPSTPLARSAPLGAVTAGEQVT